MKIYLVGGAVRDKLLGLPIKERDYVVVGATEDEMLKLGYQRVGKEFPVFLHPKTREEYALARRERKTGPGYKGFDFDTSPQVELKDDLLRRDLTINAMAELDDGTIEDPYHGQDDLKNKILRHVSIAFAEDPVRILRVGRFLARYAGLGFTVAPETISLMREMVTKGEVNALVAERVWKELERALGEKNPEKFFESLNECGALDVLFPNFNINGNGIAALKAAASLSEDSAIRFAALLYDYDERHELCKTYRVPNDYSQLCKLVADLHTEALNANALSADQLLDLFSRLDIFRREERFESFLSSCQAIAHILQNNKFNADWLRACAKAAKAFPIQELLEQGFEGAQLAEQIRKKRLEQIAAWLKNQ